MPVVATVAGWLVVSRQHDLRARRQEIRSLIDELRERCDRAVEAADVYWNTSTTAAERKSAAVKLKAGFPAVTRILNSISAAGLAFEGWEFVVQMRQAATGEEFERKGRRPRSADQEKVLDMSLAAEDLMGAVDQAYFGQFPIRNQRRWFPFLAPFATLSLTHDSVK